MRYALGIEYHGSTFCGWQSQPSGCGVQDHIETALAAFIGSTETARTAVTCAGRTDTGVHALAQVIHFDTEVEREVSSWVRGTNAYLPDGIRILWAIPVPDTFHARFSARSRTYRYVLVNDHVDVALLKGMAGWFHAPLHLGAMQEAAQQLLGEHDFSAFRAAGCQAKSPIKTLYDVGISQRGQVFLFTFRANAFLHHMIRNIVGALVYVGAGRLSMPEFLTVLSSGDRTNAPPTFSPDGLYLAAIEYDADLALPAFPLRHFLFD